jgi:predicted transcriptional regulator
MNQSLLNSDSREDRTVAPRERAQTVVILSATSTKEYFMSQTLLEMAKDLVMAQIEAHRLSPEEMHTALQLTYASLKALQAREDANGSVAVVTPGTPPEPVNWKKSITKHTVTCLECGASFKQLSGRHLKDHGLDGRSYREKYRIPRTQPLAAKEITARRKEIVQRSRPWEKAPTFMKAQKKAQQAIAQRKKTTKTKA